MKYLKISQLLTLLHHRLQDILVLEQVSKVLLDKKHFRLTISLRGGVVPLPGERPAGYDFP